MPRSQSRKKLKRLYLFNKQKGLCGICHQPMYIRTKDPEMSVTLDHIIPKSLGGPNDIFNLRAAHKRCNEKRGSDMSCIVTGLVDEWYEGWWEI